MCLWCIHSAGSQGQVETHLRADSCALHMQSNMAGEQWSGKGWWDNEQLEENQSGKRHPGLEAVEKDTKVKATTWRKWWNDDGDNVMGAHDTIQRKLDNTSNPSLRSGCEQISNYGKRIHLTNFEGYESNNPFVRQIIRAHCHTILVNRTEQWWCSVGFCSWTVQGLFSCASVGRMETTVNQVDSVLDDLPKSWCN